MLLCFSVAPSVALAWEAEVERVIDGDSIVVVRSETGKKETIRLFGVDCPEFAQPYGKEATDLTRSTVTGKKVSIVAMDVDKNGRTVAAVVCLGDGATLQDELLKAGLAWVDPRFCKNCKVWKKLQREAAQAKRGLWQDDEPTAPWKWRKNRRESGKQGK